MHLPDGMLSRSVLVAAGVAGAGGVVAAVRGAGAGARGPNATTYGVVGAGVFVAQLLNVPVGGGMSAHALGGAALGATLGFAPAALIVSGVVAMQALLLRDGGLSALGANIFNMAIVAPAVAAVVMRVGRGRAVTAAVAAAVGTFAAVAACSVELSLSARGPATAILDPLLRAHLPVALAEGLCAAVAVHVLARRTELTPARRSAWGVAVVLALIAAIPLRSTMPDALETVAATFSWAR